MPLSKQVKIRKLAKLKVDKKRFTFVVKAAKKEEEFRIRSRLEKVTADCLTNALNKVLALHQGKKIVTTKFYLNNMDLITAKIEAAAKTKQKLTTIFVNVYPAGNKNEGDCFFSDAGDKTTQAIYRRGEEIKPKTEAWDKLMDPSGHKQPSAKTLKEVKAVPSVKVNTKHTAKQEKEIETKTTKVMEAKVKKSNKAAKVASKAAKKVEAKATKTPAKKEAAKPGSNGVPKNAKGIGAHALAKEIRNGAVGFNFSKRRFAPGWLEKQNKTKEYLCTVATVDGVKTFQQYK